MFEKYYNPVQLWKIIEFILETKEIYIKLYTKTQNSLHRKISDFSLHKRRFVVRIERARFAKRLKRAVKKGGRSMALRYRYARTHKSAYNVHTRPAYPVRRSGKREERGKCAPYRGNGPTEPVGFLRVKRVKRSPRQIQLASKQRVVIAKRNAHWGDVERGDRLSIPLPPSTSCCAPWKQRVVTLDRETFSMHRVETERERGEKKIFIFYNCIGGTAKGVTRGGESGGPLTWTWRLPDGFLLALYIFILFSLKLAGGFEWPLLLYVARKFEVTNFVLPLWGPLSCSWRVSPCETFGSLSKGSRFRIALDSLDTWHSIDLRLEKWGTPDSIEYPSYFVPLSAWNENFFKGGSVAALDKGLTVSGILLILDDSLTFISKIFLSFDRAILRDGNYVWSSCLIRIQDGKWWEEVD